MKNIIVKMNHWNIKYTSCQLNVSNIIKNNETTRAKDTREIGEALMGIDSWVDTNDGWDLYHHIWERPFVKGHYISLTIIADGKEIWSGENIRLLEYLEQIDPRFEYEFERADDIARAIGNFVVNELKVKVVK